MAALVCSLLAIPEGAQMGANEAASASSPAKVVFQLVTSVFICPLGGYTAGMGRAGH